jgi:hypothetical protein
LNKSGRYHVQATFACAPGSEGREVVLSVGNQEFPVTVEATQGWDSFETEDVGEVEINWSGPVNFVLKAASMPHGAVVNVRQIVFKPVD